jgi:hypothetical protein
MILRLKPTATVRFEGQEYDNVDDRNVRNAEEHGAVAQCSGSVYCSGVEVGHTRVACRSDVADCWPHCMQPFSCLYYNCCELKDFYNISYLRLLCEVKSKIVI